MACGRGLARELAQEIEWELLSSGLLHKGKRYCTVVIYVILAFCFPEQKLGEEWLNLVVLIKLSMSSKGCVLSEKTPKNNPSGSRN